MLKLKSYQLGLLALLLVVFYSCNSEEEVAPEEEDPIAALAFNAQNPPVQLPTAIQNSSNQYAAQVNSFAALANAMAGYSTYFEVPEGAEFSTTPIDAANSRIAADVRVYTWTFNDGTTSISYAYQLSEDDTDYVYEIFYKFNEDGFYKLLEGRESKNELVEGSLKWFGLDESNAIIYSYTWKEFANGAFNLIFEGFTQRLVFDIAIDGSGVIEVFEDGVISGKYTWNADGTAGTFTSYTDGVETDSINWTTE